jgi:hypothetical protein
MMRPAALAFSIPFLVVLARLAPAASFTTTSEMLGTIAGPTTPLAQPGLAFYGTDLGWTVEHDGTLLMLFGDTWPRATSCATPCRRTTTARRRCRSSVPPARRR